MKAILDTRLGRIVIQLDTERAPLSAENFAQYVRDGFFDGTIFHRVIPNFMVQGGGFTADMSQKTTREPIQNEAGNGLSNVRGTVAMARTNQPHSASSQFFINVVDNLFLDKARSQDGWGYAVFGEVVEGMDIVDNIRQVPTGNHGMHQDVPKDAITIDKASIEE